MTLWYIDQLELHCMILCCSQSTRLIRMVLLFVYFRLIMGRIRVLYSTGVSGPNEVLSVDDITFSNDYFWAYDITSQKWIGNDFGDIFNKKANTDKRVVDFKSLSYMGG